MVYFYTLSIFQETEISKAGHFDVSNIIIRNKVHKKYREVPKVTTLVTFGFSSLFLSLLLESLATFRRYFLFLDS